MTSKGSEAIKTFVNGEMTAEGFLELVMNEDLSCSYSDGAVYLQTDEWDAVTNPLPTYSGTSASDF